MLMHVRDGILDAVRTIRSQMQQVAEHGDVRGELLAEVKVANEAIDAVVKRLEETDVQVMFEVPVLESRPHIVMSDFR